MRIFYLFLLLAACPIQAVDTVEGVLKGQLGNQFFIIATTVSLALDNGPPPFSPTFYTGRKTTQ